MPFSENSSEPRVLRRRLRDGFWWFFGGGLFLFLLLVGIATSCGESSEQAGILEGVQYIADPATGKRSFVVRLGDGEVVKVRAPAAVRYEEGATVILRRKDLRFIDMSRFKFIAMETEREQPESRVEE